MKKVIILLASVMMLGGCSTPIKEDTAVPDNTSSVTTGATEKSETSSLTTQTSSTSATTTATTYIEIDEVIPQAIQTPKIEGDRLSYTIINIYADGQYYNMEVSGVKLSSEETEDIDNTYINGELYGDFRIDLLKDGELLDSYKINIPRDDRFLILESVTQGLSYGSELFSQKRLYNIDEYPDLLQLDFYIINEVETPQYARYFAIYDEKITEVKVFENGAEAAPHGTHLQPESEGVMIQYVVESDGYGGYYVQMYRYWFDNEARCLTRKKVNY